MASFTVNSGVTDTTPKTVSNNDIGTIEAGGTLTAATPITWTGGSNAPGVVIDNSGAINGTTRAINSSGAFAAGGSITVNNNAGATITATGNDAWRINNALNAGGTITLNNAGTMTSNGGQTLDFEAVTSVNANVNINNASTGIIRSTSSDAIRPGAGDIVIDNGGLIESTAARGINLNTTNLTNITSFQLTNDAGATIRGLTDAVRITAGTLSPTATGTYVIDNAGTIESTGVGGSNGQALDLNDLVSPLGSVTITNQATGILRAADADAVRTGTNATVNNYGQIVSLNGTPTSDGNDGIDFQANTGGVVNNFAGGLIDGARHGITGDAPITVTNGGTIIGRVGAGINMDTASTTTTTVTNTGTITGITVEGVQSGDSVDVDGLIHLDNYGLIEARRHPRRRPVGRRHRRRRHHQQLRRRHDRQLAARHHRRRRRQPRRDVKPTHSRRRRSTTKARSRATMARRSSSSGALRTPSPTWARSPAASRPPAATTCSTSTPDRASPA